MGYSPRDVREMSLWEFHSCVAGFIKANNPEKSNSGLTHQEIEELSDLLDNHKEIHGA